MSYTVKDLLVLPAEEKIMIADLLYSSVNAELEANSPKTEWWKNEKFVDDLNHDFEEWKQGKAKGYSMEDVKDFMKAQKAKMK